MKQVFSEQGIPACINSDNGGHFDSWDFMQFLESYGIDHDTSSPRYPRSNGLVERFVETVKTILSKARDSKTDPKHTSTRKDTDQERERNIQTMGTVRTVLISLRESHVYVVLGN